MNDVNWHTMSQRILSAIIILMFASLLSCAATSLQPSHTGMIKGIVVGEDDQPISGAKIEINGIVHEDSERIIVTLYSDVDGKFSVANIPDSTLLLLTIDDSTSGYFRSYNYLAKYTGFKPVIYRLIKYSLNTGGKGQIFGKVMDIRNKALSASISIVGSIIGDAASREGMYKISNIDPGDYKIKASIFAFGQIITGEYILAADEIININFIVKPSTANIIY